MCESASDEIQPEFAEPLADSIHEFNLQHRRIEGKRHQNEDTQNEWNVQALESAEQETHNASVLQALPYEQARDEKQERHEERIIH